MTKNREVRNRQIRHGVAGLQTVKGRNQTSGRKVASDK